MWITAYILEIKKQLRDTHHIKPTRMVGEEPLFDDLPDGDYPMVIEGKLDRVRVVNGRFECCRFDEPPPALSRGKKYEHWCTDAGGKPMCLGWSNSAEGAFAKCVESWPGKSAHRTIDLTPGTSPLRRAVIVEDFGGKFSRWEIGEAVLVHPEDEHGFMVEREAWNGPLPLLNQCYGVPASALKFCDEPSPDKP